MNHCYKCNRENPDSYWSSLCADCRYAISNPPKAKTFLDRLTMLDLAMLEGMRIAVEPDMRKAVSRSQVP